MSPSHFVNGRRSVTLPADARGISFGRFKLGERRRYSLVEIDVAGNASVRSPALRSIPKLKGKNLKQARRALRGYGFRIGRVRWRNSPAPRGRLLAPVGNRVAVLGSRVPLLVSRGPRRRS